MGKRGKLPTNSLPIATEVGESKEHEARERRYRAEEGLRTLERAEECKRDSGLMKDIKKLAADKMKALKKI
jgi:hypothetical protein